MKKVLMSMAAIAMFAGHSQFLGTASAQANRAKPAGAQKMGLIDMAYIFKNYEKFKVLGEDLKDELAQSESEGKSRAERIKSLRQELRTFKEGSEKFSDIEARLTKEMSEFETFRRQAKRGFLKKESKIYKTVYLEVSDLVKYYAEAQNFVIVLRFNREGLSDSDTGQGIIQKLNRQVVYYRPENDITKPILEFMNDRYSKAGGRAAKKRPDDTATSKRPSRTNRR